MRSPVLVVSLAFVVCSAAALSSACGSSSSDSDFGSSGASGGASGTSGASGAASGGASGFGGTSSGTSGDADGGGDGASCFAPVDMYIVFDKSGSMGDPAGNGTAGDCNIGDTKNSKWCHAVNALAGYLDSSAATAQSAALQFFSDTDNPNCATGTPYDKPAVPTTGYTTLPSTSFNAVLNSNAPGGGTPMEAALRGLTTFTAANRRPGHVTIGILVTDGDPQGCEMNIGKLATILSDSYTTTKIRTYVIGMTGATFANLDQLAVGGGGPTHAATVGTLTDACGDVAAPCHVWNVGDGDPQGFIQALGAIQQSANGCNPGGGTINPPN